MLRVTLSGSLNFQFGAFTVLVVLIHSCRGQHHVIGPSQPIVATVGEDVVLPAYLHPATNALRVTVEWTRPDLSPRFVHVLRQGVKLIGNYPSYEGRTSLFTDELKSGKISLKLSRVRISDEGRYRCFIPELDKDHVIQLVVGAASSPVVQKTKNSSRVVLQCNSTGWYPEPEVFWLDGEGNLLSAGPTETVRGPDDLYTVSSRVTVEKRHSNSFTCRVQQNHTNQTRETHIHVPDDFFSGPSGSSSSLPVIIGLILGIVFVLAAAAVVVVWKWRQNKIRNKKQREDEEGGNSPELKLLMGEETDGKHPTEETETVNNVDEFRGEAGQTETDEETLQQEANNAQSLTEEDKHGEQQTAGRETLRDREKENMKKELKTKEKELEKFEEQVSRYEEQIKDKEKQIHEVKQQLEEVKRQTEDTERKMRSEKKKEDKDYKRLSVLNRKEEELQEQLEKLETQLEGIKKSESVSRQKKRRATNEKEEIIKKLKELEMQNNQSDPVDSLTAGPMMMDVD
ncbi:butyrophilin-like protein 9 isoform 3-T4 [Acanthopagrus schlegelii]